MKIAAVLSIVPLLVVSVAHGLTIRDFERLSCNSNLNAAVCKSWQQVFGKVESFSQRVVIPCGSCVKLDTPRESITLNAGLDVHGKLVVPDGMDVTMYSTAIIVQGELEVDTRATKSYVDGKPRVRFVMIGEREEFFEPIGENKEACYGSKFCLAGSKSITVAGGQVTIHGIPAGTPTWVKLHDVTSFQGVSESSLYVDGLVVSDIVAPTWSVGAEILITSHTREWNGHQVRTIIDTTEDYKREGFVVLRLNAPVIRPITQRDDRDFAVEVALLSRNVQFDAMPMTGRASHGGHFWIHHTPKIVQTIEGVDIRSFGQQGVLGRYPLHFHVCGDLSGSVASRNTIRYSNQRCVVLHATDNLQVSDNIAFDTKGHCYMLEDGIETGNLFARNLGAMTGVPEFLIPDSGTNGRETDFMPSTFWITNPTNLWVDNIAAGSQGSGYWIEPMKRGSQAHEFPHIDPKFDPILLFKGNEAHSNADKGLRSYPSGYLPLKKQTMFGFKSYRNDGTGIFLHNTRNLRILRGRVADNKHIGIDIDNTGGILIQDVKVAGISTAFHSVLASQDVSSPCRTGRLHGIELHTWQAERVEGHVEITGVMFQGFDLDFCPDSVPIHFEGDTKTGEFDAFTTLHGVTQDTKLEAVDMCSADGENVDNIYVTDLDSGVLPRKFSGKVGTSTMLGHQSHTLNLLDASRCMVNDARCLTYCPNVCLRTIQFEIDPSGTEKYSVRACKISDPSVCVSASGFRWSDSSDAFLYEPRMFNLQITAGEDYTITVLDPSGASSYPSFIRSNEVDSPCGSMGGRAIVLTPPLQVSSCTQLIRNGQLARTDGMFWLHRFGGLEVTGSGSSVALSSMSTSSISTIVQYLDVRCIQKNVGQYYEIVVYIKLEGLNGSPWFCDSDRHRCPVVGLFDETSGFHPVATVDPVVTSVDGYQKANGFIKIDKTLADANEVRFYVRSNVEKKLMFVRQASMRYIEDPDRFCFNLIDWPLREPSHLWDIQGSGLLSSVLIDRKSNDVGSQSSIYFSKRKDFSDTMIYEGWRDIELRCVVPGSKWRIVTKLRLEDPVSGESLPCTSETCPEVKFSVRDFSGERFYVEKSSPSCWEADEWSTCKMFLHLPLSWDGTIQRMVLEIADFSPRNNLSVLDVYMKPMNN